MITLSFTTTRSEQTAVCRRILYGGWSYWCLLALLTIGPLVVGSIAADHEHRVSTVHFWAAGVGCVLWHFFPWLYVTFKRQGVPGMDGPHTYALGPEGLMSEYPHGKAELKWGAFSRAKETRAHVLLFVGSGALYIPKRVLSVEQLLELRALLVAELGRHAHLGVGTS